MATTEPLQVAAEAIRDSIAAHQRLLDEECLGALVRAANVISDSLKRGGKLLLFGNGGSASDAGPHRG